MFYFRFYHFSYDFIFCYFAFDVIAGITINRFKNDQSVKIQKTIASGRTMRWKQPMKLFACAVRVWAVNRWVFGPCDFLDRNKTLLFIKIASWDMKQINIFNIAHAHITHDVFAGDHQHFLRTEFSAVFFCFIISSYCSVEPSEKMLLTIKVNIHCLIEFTRSANKFNSN